MNIRFVVWDWRGGLTVEEFVKAINEFHGGPVYAAAVDAGTDDYILALSDEPITAEVARRRWEESWRQCRSRLLPCSLSETTAGDKVLASDIDLKKLLADGGLKVEPYEPALLQPASLDLRLDRLFEIFSNHRHAVIDPQREHPGLTETVSVDAGKPFVLHPGEFVLGATYERITLDDTIAGRVEGKSSLGRLGLLVHSTAGFIDPGFGGHITLELSNVNNLPIRLWPGMPIGQLCIMPLLTPSLAPYGSALYGSHYQNQPRGPQPSRSWQNFRIWPTTRPEEPTHA